MSICLIAVVSGEAYVRYAEQLFESAREHVKLDLKTVMLEGRPGWPDATLYRYHTVLEHASELDADYLYLVDADMRFEEEVGEEILGRLVATQHPGYINGVQPPYERRPESAAYVKRGKRYYCGGFVGGQREWFLGLAQKIASQIDRDRLDGILARWHDESHLNRALVDVQPSLTLSPAYCHPDDDSGYLSIWPEVYARKLVALDKSPAERNGR